jgi:serine/threonine-protein kinase
MSGKASLLFVDDEERIVKLLRLMFRGAYQVHTATSGPQALEIAAAHPIDVIVSDQRMPGMSGIELLSEVRRRFPATMRILLTGYSDLTAIVGSVNDGEVFRFINKPWNNDEIKRIIAEAAQAAQMTAQMTAPALPSSPADSAPAPLETAAPDRPGVLVIDDAPADRKMIADVLSESFAVYGAADIPQALRILEERHIGTIVSEAQIGGHEISGLLHLLKRHHPTVTTVMLTNAADSDLIIKLINEAQIYRFGVKPIRGSAFRLAVTAALREHQRMSANPTLTVRHRVDAAAASPDHDSLVASVMSSLTRLRARFRRLAGFGDSR